VIDYIELAELMLVTVKKFNSGSMVFTNITDSSRGCGGKSVVICNLVVIDQPELSRFAIVFTQDYYVSYHAN
jgi:hypothetical protein